jgi:hypothetical protein
VNGNPGKGDRGCNPAAATHSAVLNQRLRVSGKQSAYAPTCTSLGGKSELLRCASVATANAAASLTSGESTDTWSKH